MKINKLRQIYEVTNGHCHFCGDPVDFDKRGWNKDLTGYWEVDHVIQRGKGGSKGAENCLPACTRCNRLRWHRTGSAVRELLLLGLIAKEEIKKKTIIGKVLVSKRQKRLFQNRSRRRHKAKENIT